MKTTFLLCLISLLGAATLSAEPGWDTLANRTQAGQLLAKKNYSSLDALCETIKRKGYDIRQQYPELEAFYVGLHPEDNSPEEVWIKRGKQLDDWIANDPDSVTAKIAGADFHVFYAWHSRGSGWASSITQKGGESMDANSEKAAALLDSLSSNNMLDDPMYYNLRVQLCTLQGSPKTEMFSYLNKGIKLAPEFYLPYVQAAQYLMARWYGDGPERENWMKTWADGFPPDKGDVFYAYLLSDDMVYYGDNSIFKLPIDYNRAKNGLLKRLAGNDPGKWKDENCLAHITSFRGDNEIARKMYLDIEDSHVFITDWGNPAAYWYLREHCGAKAAIEAEHNDERAGKLGQCETELKSFTSDPSTYWPLLAFYVRQGAEPPALKSNITFFGKTLRQLTDANAGSITPDQAAELCKYFPMVGRWDKALGAAAIFDQARPFNWIGKNTMIMSALHHKDKQRAKTIFNKITELNATEPIYQIGQSILTGDKTWEQVKDSIQKSPYLPNVVATLALYYICNGNYDEAKRVINDTIGLCDENRAKDLMRSLLYGSLARDLYPPAPATPVSAPKASP